jgi:crossover junction endodeoxyribonuclease RuvC
MHTSNPTRIIGLDPGLRFTGWGVIEVHGSSLKHIAHGIVKVPSNQSMAKRLSSLYHQLATLLTEYQPEEAAVEETFVNKNPASALKLGAARGVILLAPANQGLSVAEYSANTIKKSVVGAGHADKSQVEMMVKTLLPACRDATKDSADALAVAICHAHYRTVPLIA